MRALVHRADRPASRPRRPERASSPAYRRPPFGAMMPCRRPRAGARRLFVHIFYTEVPVNRLFLTLALVALAVGTVSAADEKPAAKMPTHSASAAMMPDHGDRKSTRLNSSHGYISY